LVWDIFSVKMKTTTKKKTLVVVLMKTPFDWLCLQFTMKFLMFLVFLHLTKCLHGEQMNETFMLSYFCHKLCHNEEFYIFIQQKCWQVLVR
jgi:hypothetical protein